MTTPTPDSATEDKRVPTDSRPHRRPRFELEVELDAVAVLQSVRSALQASSSVRGMVLDSGCIELTGTEERVRFWSPQLTIDVEEMEGGSLLHARFAPHPHVWGLYLALYATSVAFAIACTMYGVSQWMLDSDPWALYLIPISFVLSALVYGASYVGQGLGAMQMLELRVFVEKALGLEGRPKRHSAADWPVSPVDGGT